MKQVYSCLFLLLGFITAHSQNVGIGTTTPVSRLHVADSNVLFTGPVTLPPSTTYFPAVEGAGTRLLWYPQKAAFRAGVVNGVQWDKDSIGIYSFATGNNTKAKGEGSFAAGSGAIATGNWSTAMGQLTEATGERSVALGYVAKAMGFANTAIGFAPVASGVYAHSIGNNTEAKGNTSFAFGHHALANVDLSMSIGFGTVTNNSGHMATGRYNEPTGTNRLFDIGNGVSDAQRANAFSILQNGNTGIGVNNPLAPLHVDSSVLFTTSNILPSSPAQTPITGGGYRAFWYADKAAFRTGGVSNNSWDREFIGVSSFAAGFSTQAWGSSSAAFGNFAYANGDMSFAAGNSVFARAKHAATFGTYNDFSDAPSSTEASSDRLFQIGNGTGNSARSNALTILRNGNMGIGVVNPAKPLSFPAILGEKILLYPGTNGEVGMGVYGNELRLHCDNPGSMISFGTQDNAGVFTQAGRFQINGAYALYVNGNIWANGTTYASDARFKQHITAIESPIQKLMQLNGVEYEMRTTGFPANHFQPGRQMGLLAQDVEKVVPEAVNELNGYKGVDYARLVPLLIESIKEQQQQIDELKAIIKNNQYEKK